MQNLTEFSTDKSNLLVKQLDVDTKSKRLAKFNSRV